MGGGAARTGVGDGQRGGDGRAAADKREEALCDREGKGEGGGGCGCGCGARGGSGDEGALGFRTIYMK